MKNRKLIILLILLLSITFITTFKLRRELISIVKFYTNKEEKNDLYPIKKNDFLLNNNDEFKLINSAIKQNYNIFFSGNIVKFDSLIIGKGIEKYLSSYIVITRDSIVFNKIAEVTDKKAYKHNFNLKNNLTINIEKKIDSTFVTIINEKDTLKITSDFVGMNEPFIHSIGSTIKVKEFSFNYDNFNSNVFVFGDSYVSCSSPLRWPYYIYNKKYNFLCDGLPGGKSLDSYDYIKSAFSIHKPKYVIWCLGMNDGSDNIITDLNWKYYTEKVMDLCNKNNVTLILSTIPSVPTRDNSGKNSYIRTSKYRYIDFDKAVSDSKGNWKNGMLSKDGVHPSQLGAKVLADEFIKAFPEIKNN